MNLNNEQALEIEALAEEAQGITDPNAQNILERTFAAISKSFGNKKAPAPAEDSEDEDEDEDNSEDEDEDDSDDDNDDEDESDSDDDEDEDDDDSDDDEEDDDEEDEKPVRRGKLKKSFDLEDDDVEYEDDDEESDPFLSKSLDDSEDDSEPESNLDVWGGAMLEYMQDAEDQNQTLIKCLLETNERLAVVSERLEAIEGNQNGQSDAILEICKSIDSSVGVAEENSLLVKSLTEQMEGLSRTPNGTYSQLGVNRPETLRKSFGDGLDGGVTRNQQEKRFGLSHNDLATGVGIYVRDNPENDKGIDLATYNTELKKSLSDISRKYFEVAAEALDIALEED